MFEGIASDDKDPRKSLHVGDVPTPELAPDEVYVAVMASSDQLQHGVDLDLRAAAAPSASSTGWARRASGAPATPCRTTWSAPTPRASCCRSARRCATGSRATGSTVHCNHVDDQDPSAHDDSMLAANQRIWGFETNFGGLADLAVVKANQLMPKPAHLTWEEAAVNALCNSTSYRMLVGRNGARMKQGDVVLIWGATGGIGGYAVQYVLNGGGIPVGVVSLARQGRPAARAGRRARHRPQGGRLPVLEGRAHPGRGRVAPARQGHPRPRRRGPRHRVRAPGPLRRWARRCSSRKRGGTVVTCAATSGYMIEYDNRHLWMKLKTHRRSATSPTTGRRGRPTG